MRRHRLEREQAPAETALFPQGKPTKDWNKKEIVAYLATLDVKASESQKKDDLLALVPTDPEPFNPGEHEPAEVLEYLAAIDDEDPEAHDAEVIRVVEAEKSGQNRPEIIESVEGTPEGAPAGTSEGDPE